MGQRGYCHYLYGIACLIRALVLRWTYATGHLLKNWEPGIKRKYLNTCRLQIFHYISNHFKWVVFANSRGICWLRTPTGKGRRGQRPTRAPRNSPRGTKEEHSLSTSLRSRREGGRRCFGEVHSTFSSAGIAVICLYRTKVVLQGWAVLNIVPHHLFLLYLQIISERIRCDSRSSEFTTWNRQITPIKCLSSEKSWCSCK